MRSYLGPWAYLLRHKTFWVAGQDAERLHAGLSVLGVRVDVEVYYTAWMLRCGRIPSAWDRVEVWIHIGPVRGRFSW